MKDINIGFIGCGNMARSLIGGLIADGHPAARISASDPDPAQRERAHQFDIEVLEDNDEVIKGADVVVLAVKPQVLPAVVRAAAASLTQRKPLLISIAAGIRIDTLRRCLGEDLPTVRVMPNTPSLIQAGATALFAGPAVTREQRDLAEGIMRSVVLALWLEDEAQMDVVTAVSGSGPAYFFLVMEAIAGAGVKLGLAGDTARLLTLETALGAAKMAMESESDPAALRQQVTSPGGTTEQALKVLMEEGHIEELFARALAAAKRRSEELAAELGEA
jgi:pyrroline-5-carboxylate reductase